MRILSIMLCIVGGCLSGCQVSPMPASKLFGVSNPSLVMDVPSYGTLKVPTNFKGRFKIDKNPDGTLKVDFTIASNASEVVDAEGNRIDNMEAQRIADLQRVIAQEQIRSAERIELYRIGADIGKAMLPLLARPQTETPGAPVTGTGPAPPLVIP